MNVEQYGDYEDHQGHPWHGTYGDQVYPAYADGMVERPLRGVLEVDPTLIDATVVHLRNLIGCSKLEIARSIGEHITLTYFGSSLIAFEKLGKKHATFRCLASDPRVPYGSTWLWYAVRVYGQFHVLGHEVASRLTLAHHRILIPIKDVELKYELGRRTLEEGWSRDQLAAQVPSRRNAEAAVSRCMTTLSRLVEEIRVPDPVEVSGSDQQQLLDLIQATETTLNKLCELRTGVLAMMRCRDMSAP